MQMRPAALAAELDHLVRPALCQERRQIDAQALQRLEMLAALGIAATLAGKLLIGVGLARLPPARVASLGLSQLRLLLAPRELQVVRHLRCLLLAPGPRPRQLRLQLEVLELLRLLLGRAIELQSRAGLDRL